MKFESWGRVQPVELESMCYLEEILWTKELRKEKPSMFRETLLAEERLSVGVV